ncbi:MAG: prepilin-type N-terminal cleavage/methylation domain-containing protein [Deltaproteobacteria bacterium]|nr:MAG: prepilin-type N-terminal cleavage/methylation domain-containing protein [Deltaproteobacteria bacterium]
MLARMRDRQAGFTLIELLVALAVVSILAAIALPSFFGESRKARASAEVQPMFNDLRVRLEQFMQENGVYPATIGEGTLYPPVQPPPAWSLASNPLPATWQAIRVRPSGIDRLWCAYTWATGKANDASNIGPIAAGSFTATPPVGFDFTAPPTDWYYLLAKCDMDGQNDGSDPTFSWYFTSSVDATIRALNEGK